MKRLSVGWKRAKHWKSPRLNPIEPCWLPGQRAVLEPARELRAAGVKERVCDHFGGEHVEPLTPKAA